MDNMSADLDKKLGSDQELNPEHQPQKTISTEEVKDESEQSPNNVQDTNDTQGTGLNDIPTNDSDPLETQLSILETKSKSSPPSTLYNRYDIYPSNPLPEFDSPSARAFRAEDRMQPKLQLFGLICIPGLPVRLNEIEKISGKALPGNLNLVSFGNIDWPILGQKCTV